MYVKIRVVEERSLIDIVIAYEIIHAFEDIYSIAKESRKKRCYFQMVGIPVTVATK